MDHKNEPWLTTPAELTEVLEELKVREPIFHRPELGTCRADYEKMVVPDYWEVGASGKRYSGAFVLDVLEERQKTQEPEVWQTNEFHCRKLAEDLYLLTYTLKVGELSARKSRRSTIWRRAEGVWKIVYHQGTVIQGE